MTETATAEAPAAFAIAPQANPSAALPAVAAQALGQLVPTSPAGLMMSVLAQGGSLDLFERMLDVQERWERREAEKAFYDGMTQFRARNIVIPKRRLVEFDSRVGHTEYKHAVLSDVTTRIGPPLSELGFSWSWKMRQEGGAITVTCVLRHRQGHADEVSLTAPPDPSGGKNGIQAVISTTSYLERHTLKAITGTAEADEDDDGKGAPPFGTTDQDLNADEARGKVTVLQKWCQDARATKTRADLTRVMKAGVAVFKAANDRDGYSAFKHAIEQHGATLPPDDRSAAA
ncbi:hypothetical protein ASF19_19980 [Acidovorax sp. Leaf84]|uniref:ERF family protein n=1 Tax=Acidovorax sp. Leaf84 TaxID=1736240 RepID=UPI0006F25C58|nr:ERF family protein [Acidovorax sp. Leaf84]KQO38061.1 hypothetical protein ASF19_19980 [Acidovorax sp. Leaf84]